MSSKHDTERYGPLPKGAAQLAMLSGAVAGLQPGQALAQDGATDDDQEIIVTGSRIAQPEGQTASPVQVLSEETIRESGAATMGELIQKLPAIAGAAINPAVNNGGGEGASNIELRGLGAERTLVLLNGRRYGALGRLTSAIDANSIPVTMIERVEILKQGAGAIYGSDAIGGVVNFITKKETQGLDLSVDYGESSEGDGERKGGSITWGTSDDKGSVMLGFNYNKQDEISAGDRAFSRNALYFYGSIFEGGSSRTPRGRYFFDTESGEDLAAAFPDCEPDGGITRIEGAPGTSLADFRCYVGTGTPNDSYNYQPLNLILTPTERSSVFALASHDITDDIEMYGEFLYNRTTSGFQIAPLPFDSRGDNVVISADNIYNPFGISFGGQETELVPDPDNPGEFIEALVNPNATFRLEALGNRDNSVETWQGQITGGLRGALFDTGWSWDASYAYSRMDQDREFGGYPFQSALKNALGPSFLDDDGNPTCGAPDAPIAGCIPFNIFNPTDASQVAAIQALSAVYTDKYEYEMQSAVLALSGDLFDLPAGTVGAAAGVEYRDQSGKFDTDFLTQATNAPFFDECLLASDTCTGDSYGQFDVTEFYAEVLVPLLSDAPFARSLDLTLGVRYSDYSTFGDTTNGSASIEWRPVESLLVRTSYADIFRAPTIIDLYQAPTASAETLTDPCVGLTSQQVADNPNYLLACEGVAPDTGFAQPNAQVDAQLIGGAVAGFDLQPEEGEAFTAGFVYEPLPALSISADYWMYSIDDVIQQIDVNVAAETCVQTGLPVYCDLINRFPDGTIRLFVTPTVNLGSLDTDGIDLGLSYAFPTTAIGDFRVGLDATYVLSYESQVVDGGPTTDVDGTYDRQYGNVAKWRAQGTIGWAYDAFQAQLVGRFIDSVKLTDPDGSPCIVGGCPLGDVPPELLGPSPDLEIASQIYWDATVGYTIESTNTKFQLGVNNMFDNQPPILYQNNVTNANTDVETYDTIGRFFFGSVTQKF